MFWGTIDVHLIKGACSSPLLHPRGGGRNAREIAEEHVLLTIIIKCALVLRAAPFRFLFRCHVSHLARTGDLCDDSDGEF